MESSIVSGVESLSPLAKRILGANGQTRFEQFKRYKSGWDAGHGDRLSYRSVAALETFLSFARGYFHDEPSLFLTRNGNLQLGWEDIDGNAVEIECHPGFVEVYREKTNCESRVPLIASALMALSKDLAK